MMQQPERESHALSKKPTEKISKSKQAGIDRQSKQKQEAETLSTFLTETGDRLNKKDDELTSGLTGIARRQGRELMGTLAEAIPAAYAEGITEGAKEASGKMSDNFRESTERFNANLREVFGIA